MRTLKTAVQLFLHFPAADMSTYRPTRSNSASSFPPFCGNLPILCSALDFSTLEKKNLFRVTTSREVKHWA